jgi:hypothetical protein
MAAESRAAAVEGGSFPKSIQIPGTDVSFLIGGYVKLDLIQDFDAIGNRFEFKVNTVPVEGDPATEQSGQTTLHARETRINLDVRSPRDGGDVRLFVEGDFYGDNNAFRLRHAYGQLAGLLGGQTWSTFMDLSVRPWTIDFEGPEAEIFLRQSLLRWSHKASNEWAWAIAVEDPAPQFAVPGSLSGTPRSTMPDIPGYARFSGDRGHIQVAGIVRQLRFDGVAGSDDQTETGWGLSTSLAVTIVGRDQVMGQLAFGEGIGRYVDALVGQNVDAVFDAGGSLQSLPVRAGFVAYQRHWNDRLRSAIAVSNTTVDDDLALPGSAIRKIQDARVNLIWSADSRVDLGGEVLWGRHEVQSGAEGEAVRFQLSMICHLN